MESNKKEKLKSELTSNINQQIRTSASMAYSSNLKAVLNLWPILDVIDKDILLETYMIMAIEPSTDNESDIKFIIVRRNGYVYSWEWKLNNTPKIIDNLCGKNIKTFIQNHKDGLFALTNEGEVYSWGNNVKSTLGHEQSTTFLLPTLVSSLNNENIIDIVCGANHSLAITIDGKLFAWGTNIFKSDYRPEYREYNKITRWKPEQVKFELENKKIVCIACGESYSVVVTDNGEVYAWGTPHTSILGEMQPIHRVTFSTTIVKVACGSNHALALTDQGDLYVWGKNNSGQLGTGDDIDFCSPTLLDTTAMGKLTDIAAISTKHISVAVNEDGLIYVWGIYKGRKFHCPFESSYKNVYDVFAHKKIVDKPLILSADDHELTAIRCLKDAFDNPEMSDYTIKVEDQDIHVHKIILKTSSLYFKTIFEGDWKESTAKTFKAQEFSYNVYKAYFKYLYTNMIDISSEEVLDLLQLADMYGQTNLKTDCCSSIQKQVTISNVAYFYKKSIEYKEKNLLQFCFSFILKHFGEVVKTENFLQLDKHMTNKLLITATNANAIKTINCDFEGILAQTENLLQD